MSISGYESSHEFWREQCDEELLVSMMGRKVGPIGCDLMVVKDDQKVRCRISTTFWTWVRGEGEGGGPSINRRINHQYPPVPTSTSQNLPVPTSSLSHIGAENDKNNTDLIFSASG